MQNLKSKSIIGIIPAAGKGSRLEPFPCPKELFPVGYQDYFVDGKTQKRPKVVSQYLIENIIRAGVNEIYIILGEGKSQIMDYFGNGSRFGINISYLYQEKLNGMPSALNLVYPWNHDSTVLFGMPDTIIEPHNYFQELLKFHKLNNADLTLGLFETDMPSKFGMVEVDKDDNVLSTLDKPSKTNLKLAWGCACWSSSFSKIINDYLNNNKIGDAELVLGDIFNYALDIELNVKAFVLNKAQYIDIGTTDELNSALKKFHL